MQPSCMIVGGDGLIGTALREHARRNNMPVVSTSRHRQEDGCIRFDLASGSFDEVLAVRPAVVFMCAAMTSMAACEAQPILSETINVGRTVLLAEAYLQQGAHVVFLSSNTVFNGCVAWPNEDAECLPVTTYGQQKMLAERALQALPGASERLAVVRLSKVMAAHHGMTREFFRHWRESRPCRAFADLCMCPVSLDYVVEALWRVRESRQAGVFHLAGEEELSYAQFAQALIRTLGRSENLVEVVNSEDVGVTTHFRPLHPGLGMSHTRKTLSLLPEPTSRMLALLAKGMIDE